MSHVAGLATLAFWVILVYLVSPYLYIQWLRHRQARLVDTHACIVLTFDDGPGHRLTPAILDLLDEYHAHATFFILGRNIRRKEHLIQTAVHRGHEIGTHSYDHLHSWKVSPLRAVTDIRRGQKEIARVLKTDEVMPFRPPGGKVNLFTLLFLLLKRVPIYTWTLDTLDTRPAAERDPMHIEMELEMSEGAILLAHDFDRQDSRINEYVLTTLRATLEYARSHRIRLCTMAEAMELPRPKTVAAPGTLSGWGRALYARLSEKLASPPAPRLTEWRAAAAPSADGRSAPSDRSTSHRDGHETHEQPLPS